MSDPHYFALLGLPETFAIDAQALESAWRRLQSAVHPDRHVQGSSVDRRLALQRATQLNEAYRVLRDPQRRAGYLCELRGVDLQVESNTAMPAAFLMQQMAWREALDDIRAGRDASGLQPLRDELEAARTTLIEQIGQALDQQGDAAKAGEGVRQLMFLDRLSDEIDLAHEALLNV